VCDRAGLAWCWGRNIEGELGLGSASPNSLIPKQVPGITDCAAIAGGGNHTCVLHADQTVSCWGSNASGQLGQPASANTSCPESSPAPAVPCITSPVSVPGLSGVVEIRAGEQHTCVRKSDQTVWCWGSNLSGQLGDGTNTTRSTPVAVVDLGADVVEIASGREFVCARHQAGTISCWGNNSNGQLGNGNTTSSNRPVAAAVTGALQVAAGHQHTCALVGAGAVSCWGGNSNGQLGNNTTTDSLTPVGVQGLKNTPVNSIAAGSVHTCARSAAGPAYCWGENKVNEIGDGTVTDRHQAGSVAGFM
jgi:alpha-tubulin suppressor-like RCC1 family protein